MRRRGKRVGRMAIDQLGRVVVLRTTSRDKQPCFRCLYWDTSHLDCNEKQDGPVSMQCRGLEYWEEVKPKP